MWGFAAYRFNAGPYAVSVTIVCWAAPPAVVGPLMGVYIDRLGPKRALVTGYIAAAAAALGMAAAGSLPVLDIAALAYGTARSLAGPAASALPPRIVAADDLLAANALLGSAAAAGQVAGPLVASTALALSGFSAAFIVDAASYLIGAAVVAPLRPVSTAETQEHTGWFSELVAGIVLVARRRGLRLVVAVSIGITFTSAAFLVVEPLYARHVLHRPPSQFALFEAAAGTGSILAGLAISRIKAQLTGNTILSVSAICYGLAATMFIGTASVPVAYSGAFLWGISGALFGAVALTTLQQAAPVHAHGRVMSVIGTVDSWVETVGLPLGGVTLGLLGIRAGALALAGVAVVTGTVCFGPAVVQKYPTISTDHE